MFPKKADSFELACMIASKDFEQIFSVHQLHFDFVMQNESRRILNILYSGQHGNQHKDAFSWVPEGLENRIKNTPELFALSVISKQCNNLLAHLA